MLARILLFLNCFTVLAVISSSAQAATYLESGGKVVIEAESSNATGQWSLENKVAGAKGNGYLIWNGPDLFSGQNAGRDTLRYTFRVQKAGNYELRWRSYIAHGNNSTEANDSWVRFPTGKNISGQHALNGWTKVFQNQSKQWSWSAKTVDHVGKKVQQYFSIGDHVIEISGRSHGHAIDRIVLFRYAEINYSQSSFDGFGVSSTVGGSQKPQDDQPAPEPEPEPKPEPTPEPTPEPAPEPEPKPEPTPEPQPQPEQISKTVAPVVSVNGNTLQWAAVEAVSINIHDANGGWLESISGSATSWQAPASGSYFLVATNKSDWQNWGRSNTVEVTGETSASNSTQTDASTSTSGSSVITAFTGAVYSRTSVEVFWDANASSASMEYEVQRNGEVVFTGSAASYYDGSLVEGTNYTYRLAVLEDGQVVDESTLTLTTMGDASTAAPAAPVASNDGVNLRGSVYSRTALELIWDRSTDADAASYLYNVYQDDELVASSNASSYYVDGLVEGQTYRYALRIQDASGVEGQTHSIELTTFSDGDNTMVLTRASNCDTCATFDLQMLQVDGEVIQASDLFSDVHWFGQSVAKANGSNVQITRSANGNSVFVALKTLSDVIAEDGLSIVEIDSKTGAKLGTNFVNSADSSQ